MTKIHPDLSIGAVATAVGVSPALIRAWELRHGFPVPERLSGGHRRYTARQVEQIRSVMRDREAGMSLEAAIARVRADVERPDSSIFAGLRRRWPDLPVHVLSKRAMLAISRAIEDECCARAERPVLIGSFQRERFYRQSEPRWRELARTATSATVFADFPRNRRPRGGAVEIALPGDAHLLREWAVVCDAPDAPGCVAGFEISGRGTGGDDRRFEAVWSVEPGIVRDAAGIGLALSGQANDQPALSGHPMGGETVTARRAAAVTSRIVAYLDT